MSCSHTSFKHSSLPLQPIIWKHLSHTISTNYHIFRMSAAWFERIYSAPGVSWKCKNFLRWMCFKHYFETFKLHNHLCRPSANVYPHKYEKPFPEVAWFHDNMGHSERTSYFLKCNKHTVEDIVAYSRGRITKCQKPVMLLISKRLPWNCFTTEWSKGKT
jgi:hypothetical protein